MHAFHQIVALTSTARQSSGLSPVARRKTSFVNRSRSIPHQSWFGEKTAQAKPINLRPHKHTLRDVLLPDSMNLKQELVKQGWCCLYRRYASEDTVMEGLKKEAREARKELWADLQPAPQWVLLKA